MNRWDQLSRWVHLIVAVFWALIAIAHYVDGRSPWTPLAVTAGFLCAFIEASMAAELRQQLRIFRSLRTGGTP